MSSPSIMPLFPLQAVLFPGGLLGLKVFEARYLDLVARSLREGSGFGIVCLQQGRETGTAAQGVKLERVGVVVRLDEVDADGPGLLRVRGTGLERFRLAGTPVQQADGLWTCAVDEVAADALRAPGDAMQPTVQALGEAIRKLDEQGHQPFAEPYRFGDAGWVANRWCELLPVSLAAKQKLMELEDPVIRLSIVDGYLRDKQIIVG
ncbi:peptidase S16 [Rubrivivax gelatinosus]|uniref:LON peptidase substrate-binding domain-containing protein n=1 Tax=Rubrivivax gelatinosus TaxID=28068 RepID=UPI001906951A|nr:LON peptidase substrate-binding domain-containing protein [Rubrivivax gelatinosus]MBK1615357.1 peptidase S16 [Rubrivivax gelatinosus]